MTGYTRNDTGNNIADGNVIEAADLDGEFDAIVSAFAASTGHTHDGTTGEGGPIGVVGPAQDFVAGASSFSPKTDSAYDLGTTLLRWSTAYIDDLTLTNGLGVASGGTGATTATAARTNLGLAIGSDVQAHDAFLDDIAAPADPNADRVLFWDDSAGAMTFLTMGTNLSITGTTLNATGGASGDAWSDVVNADIIPDADSVRDLGNTGTRFASAFIDDLTLTNALPVAQGGTGSTTASAARTALGLGSLATANTISNSDWSGADLSLANGGTGASLVDPNADRILFWDDSAGSMAFLTAGSGLTITGTTITATGTGGDAWSDAVDANIIPDTNATRDLGSTGTRFADAFITTLTLTNDLPVTDGGTGASTASAARTNLGVAIGSDVQAYDAGLDTIANLAVTDGNFIVGNGSTWVVENGATARTSLGITEPSGLTDSNMTGFYEQGTWTPTVTGSTGGMATLNTSEGIYTRIGDLVFIQGYVSIDTTTSCLTGTGVFVGNAPFNAIGASGTTDGARIECEIGNGTANGLTNNGWLTAYDNTDMRIGRYGSNNGSNTVSASDVNSLTADLILSFSGVYRTDDSF